MVEVKTAPNGIGTTTKSELKASTVRVARSIEANRRTKPPTVDMNHPYYKEGLFGPKSDNDMQAGFVYLNRTNAMADYYAGKDSAKARSLLQEATEVEALLREKYKDETIMKTAIADWDSITDPDATIQASKRVEARKTFFKEQAEALEKSVQNQSTRLAEEMEYFTKQEADAAILFLESVPLNPQEVGYDDPLQYEQACVLAAKDFAILPLDDQGLTEDARKNKVKDLATKIYSLAKANNLSPFEMRGKQNQEAQKLAYEGRIDALYLAVASELSADPVKYTEAEQAQRFDVTTTVMDQEIQDAATKAGINQNTYEYQNIVNKVRASHLRQKAESNLQIPQTYLDQNGDPEAYRMKYHELTSKNGERIPDEEILEALHQDAVAKDKELIKRGIEKAYDDLYIAQAAALLEPVKYQEALDAGMFDVNAAVIQQEITDSIQAASLNPGLTANIPAIDKIRQKIYGKHLRKKTEALLQVPQDVDQDAYVLKWKELYVQKKGTSPVDSEVREALGIDKKVADILDEAQEKHILEFEGKRARLLEDNDEIKRYFKAAEQVIEEIVSMRNDPANTANDDELREKMGPLRLAKTVLEAKQKKRALDENEQAQLDRATKELALTDQFLQKDEKTKQEQRSHLQVQLRQKENTFQAYFKHIGSLKGMTPEFAQKIRTAMEDKWYRGNSANWDELMRSKQTLNWFWLLGILSATLLNASGTIVAQGVGQAASVGRQ